MVKKRRSPKGRFFLTMVKSSQNVTTSQNYNFTKRSEVKDSGLKECGVLAGTNEDVGRGHDSQLPALKTAPQCLTSGVVKGQPAP